MNNSELIQKFYSSFKNGDAHGMIECYADNIQFEDPAFGQLKGDDARKMWQMLIERSKGDLKIKFSNINSINNEVTANWEADYTFTATGRKVNNKIQAYFVIENGKIIQHKDSFSMWRWSRQALGWKGWLLGWTSFMKKKVQQQTKIALEKYKVKGT